MLRKIAIDDSNFRKIRKSTSIYMDQTEFLYKIISRNIYYFLSRPCRFGKSLTVDALKHIFLGNRKLFKGLYIDSSDWNWDKFPIVQPVFLLVKEYYKRYNHKNQKITLLGINFDSQKKKVKNYSIKNINIQ